MAAGFTTLKTFDRKSRENWDSLIDEWTAHGKFQLWRRHSDAVNTALLNRWLPERTVSRLLKTDLFDEAVTDGLFATLAARAGQVFGVDVSSRVAEMAGSRHPGLVAEAADVRRLPFDNASFDTVVSISTLDHFDSRDDIPVALRELARVLRPGGQLLLTLDNLAHPAVWLRSLLPHGLMMRLGLVPYAVGKTLAPRSLKAACRDAGLTVTDATAVLHCPRALAVACTRWAERHTATASQERLLAWLRAFERLERAPTRYLTGHFTAVRAIRPRSSETGGRDRRGPQAGATTAP